MAASRFLQTQLPLETVAPKISTQPIIQLHTGLTKESNTNLPHNTIIGEIHCHHQGKRGQDKMSNLMMQHHRLASYQALEG